MEIIILVAIVVVPLAGLYFLGDRDWKFKKIPQQQLKSQNRQDWVWFGKIIGITLILVSVGAPVFQGFAGLKELAGASPVLRIIFALFGSGLLYFSSKKQD